MGPSKRKRRLLGALLDNLTTSVVAALRAYSVVHDGRTAVRAGGEGRNRSEIVSSSLVSSLLGEFVFRMCHIKLSLKFYLSSNKFFSAANGLSTVTSDSSALPLSSEFRYLTVSGSHSPSGCTRESGSEVQT